MGDVMGAAFGGLGKVALLESWPGYDLRHDQGTRKAPPVWLYSDKRVAGIEPA